MAENPEESEWWNYESGSFCRHWLNPEDCDERCADCLHKCPRHAAEDGETYCLEKGCDCKKWKEI